MAPPARSTDHPERRATSARHLEPPDSGQPGAAPARPAAGWGHARRPTPDQVLALQRAVGNQALARQLQPAPPMQRVLITATGMQPVDDRITTAWTRVGQILATAQQQWQARRHLLEPVLHPADRAAIPGIITAMIQQAGQMNPVAPTETMIASPDQPYDLRGYRQVDDPQAAGEAYTEGTGAAALITVLGPALARGADNLTVTLLHELSHATPGLHAEDYAYYQDRFYRAIQRIPGLAVRNAESLAHTIALLAEVDFGAAREGAGHQMVGMDAFTVLDGGFAIPFALSQEFDMLQGVSIAAHTTLKTILAAAGAARRQHLATLRAALPPRMRGLSNDQLAGLVFAVFTQLNTLLASIGSRLYFQVSAAPPRLTITATIDAVLGRVVRVPGRLTTQNRTLELLYCEQRGNMEEGAIDWQVIREASRLAGGVVPD